MCEGEGWVYHSFLLYWRIWYLYTIPHLIFRAPWLNHNGVGSVPYGLPYTNFLIIYHGLSGSSRNHNPCFVCKQVFLHHMWSWSFVSQTVDVSTISRSFTFFSFHKFVNWKLVSTFVRHRKCFSSLFCYLELMIRRFYLADILSTIQYLDTFIWIQHSTTGICISRCQTLYADSQTLLVKT